MQTVMFVASWIAFAGLSYRSREPVKLVTVGRREAKASVWPGVLKAAVAGAVYAMLFTVVAQTLLQR